ncbi:hypothetical protein GL50803_009598 [Giardia duodenalis]|uniref:Uncharacterized protein n=1 Tax=Giardia intestinalis (strain ATCC 50803 / WB clone C6) TaxID=184922 RepID=D3KH13_GIAIC|nr:hypothetical protein GL50803_009598 [Giardia intestinalis]KAE8305902.1 hypothetical protein GL50803_009598 [Giardia intestinalis]
MIPLILPCSNHLTEPLPKKDVFSFDLDSERLLSFGCHDQCSEERDSPDLQIPTRMLTVEDTRDYSLSYPGAAEYLETSVYDYDLLVTLATDKFRNLADCH